jgi:hypothetical protein
MAECVQGRGPLRSWYYEYRKGVTSNQGNTSWKIMLLIFSALGARRSRERGRPPFCIVVERRAGESCHRNCRIAPERRQIAQDLPQDYGAGDCCGMAPRLADGSRRRPGRPGIVSVTWVFKVLRKRRRCALSRVHSREAGGIYPYSLQRVHCLHCGGLALLLSSFIIRNLHFSLPGVSFDGFASEWKNHEPQKREVRANGSFVFEPGFNRRPGVFVHRTEVPEADGGQV